MQLSLILITRYSLISQNITTTVNKADIFRHSFIKSGVISLLHPGKKEFLEEYYQHKSLATLFVLVQNRRKQIEK